MRGTIEGLTIEIKLEWLCVIPLFEDHVHVRGEVTIAGKTSPVDFIDKEVRGPRELCSYCGADICHHKDGECPDDQEDLQ